MVKGKLAAGGNTSAGKKLPIEKRLTRKNSLETARQEVADFKAEYNEALDKVFVAPYGEAAHNRYRVQGVHIVSHLHAVYVAMKGHCKGAVPVDAPMGVETYVIEYDQIDDEMRKLSPEGYGEVKCAEGPYGKKIHQPTGRAYVLKGTVKIRGESNIAKKETALQHLLDAYLVNQNVTGIKWEDVTAVQRVERSWGTWHLLQIVFGSPRSKGSEVESFYEPNSEEDGLKA